VVVDLLPYGKDTFHVLKNIVVIQRYFSCLKSKSQIEGENLFSPRRHFVIVFIKIFFSRGCFFYVHNFMHNEMNMCIVKVVVICVLMNKMFGKINGKKIVTGGTLKLCSILLQDTVANLRYFSCFIKYVTNSYRGKHWSIAPCCWCAHEACKGCLCLF